MPSIWLTTLGCAKNQVDSEKVTSLLTASGYRLADTAESADVVMVNTCAFIEEARRESVETILQVAETKRPDAKTVVIGCMAQRFGVEVERALPEVDAVVGLDRYGELTSTLGRLTGWRPLPIRQPAMDILYQVRRPAPTLPFAYVKVAEGCDKPCTFCAIPLIRGQQRSRSPINIREEIVSLTEAGVKEVVLVAQDLAAYARDLDAPGGIVELLRFISDVDGLGRLRLLYLYPKEIRPALIEEMTINPVVAPYFDLSLQHSSGRLLRAMKRPGNGDRYLDLIGSIRRANPEAALRSSFIVGFPGETDADVEHLGSFLEAAALDWAGFFPYSAEEGTLAAVLPDRPDRQAVGERLRHLQDVQEEITDRANREMVGTTLTILVDQIEDDVPVGRSYREAPEIDGLITLDRGTPGDWVEAEITAAYGTDLGAMVLSAAAAQTA